MPHPGVLAQDWLIDRMQMGGYRSNRGGICHGVAHMAKHAVLAKRTIMFRRRFNKISKIPVEKFSEVGKKSKFFKTEIHPLFNGIELYQKRS